MTGFLDVRDGAVWIVSNSMYAYIMRQLVQQFAIAGATVPTAVAAAAPRYPGDGADWRSLRSEELSAVHAAADQLLTRLVEGGTLAVAEPAQLPPVILRLAELKAILASDPRLAGSLSRPTELNVDGTLRWLAPAWLVRLLLEQMAASILLDDARFARQLLDAASTLDPGRLTFASLSRGRFGSIALDVEVIERGLTEQDRAAADSFHHAAREGCGRLQALLRRDKRAWERADADIAASLTALNDLGDRVRALGLGRGGRFRVNGMAAFILAPGSADGVAPPEPTGGFLTESSGPAVGQGHIVRLAWNPDAGGSRTSVRQAIATLIRETGG